MLHQAPGLASDPNLLYIYVAVGVIVWLLGRVVEGWSKPHHLKYFLESRRKCRQIFDKYLEWIHDAQAWKRRPTGRGPQVYEGTQQIARKLAPVTVKGSVHCTPPHFGERASSGAVARDSKCSCPFPPLDHNSFPV